MDPDTKYGVEYEVVICESRRGLSHQARRLPFLTTSFAKASGIAIRSNDLSSLHILFFTTETRVSLDSEATLFIVI